MVAWIEDYGEIAREIESLESDLANVAQVFDLFDELGGVCEAMVAEQATHDESCDCDASIDEYVETYLEAEAMYAEMDEDY